MSYPCNLPVGRTLDDKFPFTRQYGAKFALRIVFSINLLNFADRYIPLSVKPLFQEELGLSDFESSLPTTGMILVFMIFAVIFGTLNDKQLIDRRFLLSFGIIVWSIATSMAGLATNLTQLVATRSLVGLGEACYGTIGIAAINHSYLYFIINLLLFDFYMMRRV